MFHNAQNIIIHGGQFTSANDVLTNYDTQPGIDAAQMLLANVVSSAFHNSQDRFDPPKCHPETRVAIINEIINWLENLTSTTPMLWLYGPPGAGKSAIAQTVAEKCHGVALLGASFFFSRASSERSDLKGLIPTLSYQLTEIIPQMRPLVFKAIEDHPLIFQRTLEAQLKALVVDPLNALRPPLSRRLLLIIDGLDECNGAEKQVAILNTMIGLFRGSNWPLFLLCASRPESSIRVTFNNDTFVQLSKSIPLANVVDSQADIQRFFLEEFDKLKRTHLLRRHIPIDWPSREDIGWLVHKSSGQFSYASTVMKFVQSSNHRPVRRLQVIMGLGTADGGDLPFAGLDSVYHHILSAVDQIELVLDILRVVVFDPVNYMTIPSVIEDFLMYEPGEVTLALDGLHSVLQIPHPDHPEGGTGIGIIHASFTDFLRDRQRAGPFYLDENLSKAFLANACLRRISAPHSHSTNPVSLERAYLDFTRYLQLAAPTDSLMTALSHLDISATIESWSSLTLAVDFPNLWQEALIDLVQWCLHLGTNTGPNQTWPGGFQPTTIQNKYDDWLKSTLDRLPFCDCLLQLLAIVVCKSGIGGCQCVCEDSMEDALQIELGFLNLANSSRVVLDYFCAFLKDEKRAEDYAITEDFIEEVVYQYVNDHLEEIEVTRSPFKYMENKTRRFGYPSVTVASRLLASAPRCRETFHQIELATNTTPFWVSLYLWTIRTSAESYIESTKQHCHNDDQTE